MTTLFLYLTAQSIADRRRCCCVCCHAFSAVVDRHLATHASYSQSVGRSVASAARMWATGSLALFGARRLLAGTDDQSFGPCLSFPSSLPGSSTVAEIPASTAFEIIAGLARRCAQKHSAVSDIIGRAAGSSYSYIALSDWRFSEQPKVLYCRPDRFTLPTWGATYSHAHEVNAFSTCSSLSSGG